MTSLSSTRVPEPIESSQASFLCSYRTSAPKDISSICLDTVCSSYFSQRLSWLIAFIKLGGHTSPVQMRATSSYLYSISVNISTVSMLPYTWMHSFGEIFFFCEIRINNMKINYKCFHSMFLCNIKLYIYFFK